MNGAPPPSSRIVGQDTSYQVQDDLSILSTMVLQTSLKISESNFDTIMLTMGEELPEISFLDAIEPEDFVDGYARIKCLDWCGDGSMFSLWDVFLDRIVPLTEGTAEVIYLVDPWDMAFIGIRIKDGAFTEHEIAVVIGDEIIDDSPKLNSFMLGSA